jgi:chemotaxis protein MotA
MARRSSGPPTRLDLASVAGLLLALGGIIGGLMLEGGSVADIAQATGALIVFGGTLGAVMVTTPPAILIGAAAKLKLVFLQPSYSPRAIIEEIMEYAMRARRNGIVSLEPDIERIESPFLRKALSLGVDGTDIQELRNMMAIELDAEERQGKAEAKVYEAAGGYAPTIGIIGAVLGLIQVMKHLDNIDLVGKGIAVAFVATVYGVASANLFFLPAGNKLKARVDESIRMKELMLEGVSSIIQGLHPQVIERKLEAFANERDTASKSRAGSREAFAGAQR